MFLTLTLTEIQIVQKNIIMILLSNYYTDRICKIPTKKQCVIQLSFNTRHTRTEDVLK